MDCCYCGPAHLASQVRTAVDDFKAAKEKFTATADKLTAQRAAAEETAAVRAFASKPHRRTSLPLMAHVCIGMRPHAAC